MMPVYLRWDQIWCLLVLLPPTFVRSINADTSNSGSHMEKWLLAWFSHPTGDYRSVQEFPCRQGESHDHKGLQGLLFRKMEKWQETAFSWVRHSLQIKRFIWILWLKGSVGYGARWVLDFWGESLHTLYKCLTLCPIEHQLYLKGFYNFLLSQ